MGPSINCELNPANYWEWIYTHKNGGFVSGRGYPRITDGSVKGCCIKGKSVYSGANSVCPFDQHKNVDYQSVFMVKLDFILLSPDGNADGGMIQFSQNLNASDTDFYALTPGYNISNMTNEYKSSYYFDPGSCTIIIEGFEG